VKEADALHASGLSVRVVFTQSNGRERAFDEQLLADREWNWTTVRWDSGGWRRIRDRMSRRAWTRWVIGVARERIFRRIPQIAWPHGNVAERGEGRFFPELASSAAESRADLYIGHYPAGLAAAAAAASRWNARLGYDAEDFHLGEEENPEAQRRRIEFIERRYLPSCDYVTAASNGIASALTQKYGIAPPVAILNVFPWSDRFSLDGRRCEGRGTRLSLYWYSQTIGLDRGIQDVIRASALLGESPEIHLRGDVAPSVRASLLELAASCGVAEHLFFHDQVPPTELLSRAAEHDVGLALEQGHTLNRAICTTNKLFFYLLAGLAVIGTDVPGQREILQQIAPAAALYRPGDVESLAAALSIWQRDRHLLEKAKRAALASAHDRWSWEVESAALIDQVQAVVCTPAAPRLARGSPAPDV
jgi:glycosyltransferase involved in cell wall biosynthesis